jgi:hypothetical protein
MLASLKQFCVSFVRLSNHPFLAPLHSLIGFIFPSHSSVQRLKAEIEAAENQVKGMQEDSLALIEALIKVTSDLAQSGQPQVNALPPSPKPRYIANRHVKRMWVGARTLA